MFMLMFSFIWDQRLNSFVRVVNPVSLKPLVYKTVHSTYGWYTYCGRNVGAVFLVLLLKEGLII